MIGSGQADAATIRRELGEAGNTRVGIGFITWALELDPDGSGRGARCQTPGRDAFVRRSHAL